MTNKQFEDEFKKAQEMNAELNQRVVQAAEAQLELNKKLLEVIQEDSKSRWESVVKMVEDMQRLMRKQEEQEQSKEQPQTTKEEGGE